MARKETITKQMIKDGAFNLLREEGAEAVTARKLATAVGCSTQPIFRVYANMDELLLELYEDSKQYYEQYCAKFKKEYDIPFEGLAMKYINFAKDEKNLFNFLFLSANKKNTLYELINGENGYVIKELKKIPNLNMDIAEMIFMKIFVFMHGMANMVSTGEFDLENDNVEAILKEAIEEFIRSK